MNRGIFTAHTTPVTNLPFRTCNRTLVVAAVVLAAMVPAIAQMGGAPGG